MCRMSAFFLFLPQTIPQFVGGWNRFPTGVTVASEVN